MISVGAGFLICVLTGTHLDTGGSKVELLVGVGFGLIDVGVIDGGQGTVLFANSTVIKVTTRLR